MAGTPEIARKNGLLGGRPVGAKSWKTIEKDKLREHYLNEMRKNFAEADNVKEREYAINQTIGKPVEKMEVEQTTTLKVDL